MIRLKGETLASWRPDIGRGSFQLFLVLDNSWRQPEDWRQPGRRSSRDRRTKKSSSDPLRFYQDAGTSAKEPAISALGLEGKHLRGTNTDTHVQQPSDKITSKAKQVRQAADAGGVGIGVGELKGTVLKTGKAPRWGAKKQSRTWLLPGFPQTLSVFEEKTSAGFFMHAKAQCCLTTSVHIFQSIFI